jgi:CubicO group peptidase (beta-lactamase class C family)
MLNRYLFVLAILAAQALSAAAPAYYPTRGWRESTPEQQGVDSGMLAAMVGNIIQKHMNVHSVTVIRHGYVILDSYFYPYQPTATHDVASVTKSITAAIVGIAIDRGLVKVDQNLLSFFPDERPKNPDDQKQRITIGDLLAMRSGLDCGFFPGEQELEQMRHTSDWVKFALALPMRYSPGEKFGYCSPGYHLLSSVVTAASHESLADFGRKNLFEPLGIQDVVWPADEQGRTHGWGDSHFHPRDFGKIGYLYLHDGLWDGRQIVSSEWIHKSITKQSDPGRGSDGGYGYGWWLAKTETMEEFGGNGRGGQIVAVWPQKDMIVVVTGGGYPANEIRAAIARSIQADHALVASVEGNRELKEKIAEAAQAPTAMPVVDLPAIAKTISGAVYEFPRNASRIDGLSLSFSGNSDAQLALKYLGKDLTIPVELDGVYRLGPYGPLGLLAGATGKWTSESDFALDLNFISNINRYSAVLHFDGDAVQVTISESSGLIRNGHLVGKKALGKKPTQN